MQARTAEGGRTPGAALQTLLQGNRRWVEGRPARVQRSAERRAELAGRQEPIATVFTCIDSRVAPEVVFDCSIGDLAVIRTGGHVLDDALVLGSLKFATNILGTPLLLVMGHQGCGAVLEALEAIEQDRPAQGGVQAIVDELQPAYQAASAAGGAEHDLVELMVRDHTRLTARRLAEDPTISSLIDQGSLAIRAGIYALDTGEVALID